MPRRSAPRDRSIAGGQTDRGHGELYRRRVGGPPSAMLLERAGVPHEQVASRESFFREWSLLWSGRLVRQGPAARLAAGPPGARGGPGGRFRRAAREARAALLADHH